MLDIKEMANDLQAENSLRKSVYPFSPEDYVKLIVQAIKKFFVDVNHPESYDRTLYTTTEDNVLVFDYDFDIVEEEYIFILAKMKFLAQILSDLSGDGAISYTTDALSVTGAKEGYKSVRQEYDTLELERIRVFHKIMARETSEV